MNFIPIVAFLFGFAALAVVLLIVYAFAKMDEEDMIDFLMDN